MSRRRSITITDETWMRVKLFAIRTGKTPSQVVEEACVQSLGFESATTLGIRSKGSTK